MDSNNIYSNNPIYTMYVFHNDITYYLSIPKEEYNEYEIFVSFPTKDINSLTGKNKVEEIRRINDMLIRTKPNAIYLLCCLSNNELEEFASYNDNKTNLYKKLQQNFFKSLSHAFDELKNKKIKFPVNLIKENEFDSKLIDWLEIDMSTYLKSIKFNDIKQAYYDLIFNETMAFKPIDSSSGTPNTRTGGPITVAKENVKVKRLVPSSKKGFTTIHAIYLTIFLSLIIGISIAYLLIK